VELLADKRAELWTKGMRSQLVAMRREGLPNAEIAARLASIHRLAAEIGFSGIAACNRLHRLGLPVNGVPRR